MERFSPGRCPGSCAKCDRLEALSAETLRSVRDQVLAMTPTYQPPIFSSESLAQQYARLIRGESDPKE